MCGSPELFAACRVLHRLPVPRHPPCALLRLTNQCLSTFLLCGSSLFSLELFTVSPVCPPVFPGCLDLIVTLMITPRSMSLTAACTAAPILRVHKFRSFDLRSCSARLSYMRFSRCVGLLRPPCRPYIPDGRTLLFLFWRPPALPCRLQHSTIGRAGLNRRVRDGNGCVPCTYRRQIFESSPDNSTARHIPLLLLP